MKHFVIVPAILLLTFNYGCGRKESLVIEPIDERFNQQYITGIGLDTNLFSREEIMQYYQVANFSELADHQLLVKLDSVAMFTEFPHQAKRVTVLFYKKRAFVNYGDNLFESARETENGHLIAYNEDLLASIIVERMKENMGKMSIRRLLYEKNKLKLKETDTITH